MHSIINTVRSDIPRPAVFLDRDGTINVEKNYLYRIEDWEWIPGAQMAIKSLNDAGYLVVVVSNQAGIARGYYTSEDVSALHLHVQQNLVGLGASVDAYYWCPHHPDFGSSCKCRKPAPGMLFQAAQDLNIDLAASWMMGDKAVDEQASLAAGVRSLFVQTGHGENEMHKLASDVLVFATLIEAVSHVQVHTPIADLRTL